MSEPELSAVVIPSLKGLPDALGDGAYEVFQLDARHAAHVVALMRDCGACRWKNREPFSNLMMTG